MKFIFVVREKNIAMLSSILNNHVDEQSITEKLHEKAVEIMEDALKDEALDTILVSYESLISMHNSVTSQMAEFLGVSNKDGGEHWPRLPYDGNAKYISTKDEIEQRRKLEKN